MVLNKIFPLLVTRFVFSDRKHFLLPFIAITIAVVGMIVVFSVIRGFDRSLIETMTGFYPHLISLNPLDLKEAEGYRMVFSETVAQTPAGFKGVLVFGIEEEAFKKRFKSYLKQGRYPGVGECLIGEDLALENGLNIGDKLALFKADSLLKIDRREYAISGIVDFGLYQYNSRSVVLRLEDAEMFQSSLYAYYLDDPMKANEVATTFRNEQGAIVRSWLELNSTYAKALKVDQLFAIIITVFIVMLSGFGVSNSVLYSVLTRRKQVGVLISLGMEPAGIRKLFIAIPLVVSLIGAGVGSAIGVLVTFLLRFVKIPLPEDVFLTDYLPVALKVQDVLVASALVVLISVVFSVMPSSMAARTDPVEVLRGE